MSRQDAFSLLYCTDAIPTQFSGYRHFAVQLTVHVSLIEVHSAEDFSSNNFPIREHTNAVHFHMTKPSSSEVTVYLQRWLLSQGIPPYK